MAVEKTSDQSIPLRPFRDQVGGNFMLLEIDDNYICKPLQARETLFYETLPEELKMFTPEYKGMLSVSFARDDNGHHVCTGYPVKRNGILDKKDMEVVEKENLAYLRVSKRNIEAKGVEETTPTQSNQDGTNPWIDFRIKTMDTILDMREDVNKQFRYIILENLTSKFKCPCVMDLKLGTRTYTDEMSEEKKQVHLMKCDTTTSKSLGIRLAGLQVYHVSDHKYHFMDKYDGGTLTVDALIRTLNDFLFNGYHHYLELIPRLIEKLKQLREVLSNLDSYRLFSSSLLIVYEGGVETPPIKTNGKVQTEIESNLKDQVESETATTLDPMTTTTSDPLGIIPDPLCNLGPLEIRMIDFGNVTSKHVTTDPFKYEGPDEGFIMGLTSIINLYDKFFTKHATTYHN